MANTVNRISPEPTDPGVVLFAPATVTRTGPVSRDNFFIRIQSFTGEMKLNAWTNSRAADRFWVDVPLSGRRIELNVKFDKAGNYVTNCYNSPNCANRSHEWLGSIILNNGGDPIDQDYRRSVTAAFDALVDRLTRPLDRSDVNATALKNFVAIGRNTIHLRVTPISPVWSLDFQLYTNEGGASDVIQETHIDHNNSTGGVTPAIVVEVV
jgi:hypothetical protein